MSLKPLIFSVFALFLATCTQNRAATQAIQSTEEALPLTFEGRVTAIKDGDTYKVLYNGAEQTIRLAHIDCPEKKQPFGKNAKQFASDLCFGKIVTVQSEGKTDRNKRLIAEIVLPDGRNVNKELVRNGLAWHYKKYSTSEEYAQLEIEAQNQKIGLWTDPTATAPWAWRKLRKSH